MKPILFNTDMVRAIIAGQKTQTRRILDIDHDAINDHETFHIGEFHPALTDRHGQLYPGDPVFGAISEDGETCVKFPFGQPGDVLYVRETWCYWDDPNKTYAPGYFYLADFGGNKANIPTDFTKWRPSIHMPKKAARIYLRIANVRVERLQDITEEDAKAEGVERIHNEGDYSYRSYVLKKGDPGILNGVSAYSSFRTLWQSINGRESWDANPWVWVIEFEQIPMLPTHP